LFTKHRLAQTSLEVSPLGLGTVKFGRNQKVNYPQSFTLPTDQEILSLLSQASQAGINLLDTAPAYGQAEERLGTLLRAQRQNWVLSTKVGEDFVGGESHFDFTPAFIRKSIERSLKRLQTDYLDIVLVHSNGEDENIIQSYQVFDTLSQLKDSGLIRAFGMSTKTVAGGKLTIDHADVAMVTYNPTHTQEHDVLSYALQKQKSVFIKKAFASGHLDKIVGENPVQEALNFILKEKGVTSVILGTINPAHLHANIEAAKNFYRETA